jgi:S1-C subfamily serine protease
LLQRDYVNVVKGVSPSVVQIQTSEGLGSGVVFDDRGDVVTNAHVVGNANRFVVTLASGDNPPLSSAGTPGTTWP